MAKQKLPSTTATSALKQARIDYEPYLYSYVEKGGTRASAEALGVDEHRVIKTIVLEDEAKRPLICLMHGDAQISTKELARALGKKTIVPCDPEVAKRHTGYRVGGTSPFGTRKPLPIFAEKSIFDLDRIYINGGARGFLVALSPRALSDVLGAEPVQVAIPSK
jgi:Cys-tRNA(Pro) deacylase